MTADVDSMMAIVQDEYGAAADDVLRLEEIAGPRSETTTS
jgi:hypothetical protein